MILHSIWQPDTQQALFRHLMQAMTYPGRIHNLQALLDQAEVYRGILAVLLDTHTSLADEHQLLPEDDWPLLQARPAQSAEADYVLCDGAQAVHIHPRLGELANPERSATLLIKVDDLQQGEQSINLHGPGIVDRITIRPRGLNPQWWEKREEWTGAFPLGVDMILSDQHRLMCIPRSSQAEVM